MLKIGSNSSNYAKSKVIIQCSTTRASRSLAHKPKPYEITKKVQMAYYVKE